MNLTEHNTPSRSPCFHDENRNKQGLYSRTFFTGKEAARVFYLDNYEHGEVKRWCVNGDVLEHAIYVRGHVVKDLMNDILTDEDKFLLCLEHGHMEFLS